MYVQEQGPANTRTISVRILLWDSYGTESSFFWMVPKAKSPNCFLFFLKSVALCQLNVRENVRSDEQKPGLYKLPFVGSLVPDLQGWSL